ncbi:MAG: flagellar basal body-associated FliL family protein [Acidiphilium sp.]
MLLIGGAAALVLTAAGSLWLSGLLPFGRYEAVAAASPVYVDVPEIVTNLNVPSGQDSYAKLKATLELPAGSSPEAIMKDMPRVIDMFQTYLRAMRPSELRGASGTYRLREALINRVRIAVAPNVVQDVLFQELIVQ